MKTLKISDDIHYHLKITAAQLGIELQNLAEIFLTAGIEQRARIVCAQSGRHWRDVQCIPGEAPPPDDSDDAA